MPLADILAQPLSVPQFHAAVTGRFRRRAAALGRSLERDRALLERLVPEQRSETLRLADEAMRGRVLLLSVAAEPLDVGDPPRWKVQRPGEFHYMADLHRMYFLRTLLGAHAYTGERRYADKAIADIDHWIRTCPRPSFTPDEDVTQRFRNDHAWDALNAAERMHESWMAALEHLALSDAMEPEFLARFAESVHQHGETLERLPPRLYPARNHNHSIDENLGLLSVAWMLPELAAAPRWIAHAKRELERCADIQLTIEGGQIEGCPGYHSWCVYLFCKAAILARECGEPFGEAFLERLQRNVEYSLHALRPTGEQVLWGDTVVDPHVAIIAVVSAHLATGEMRYLEYLRPLFPLERVKASALMAGSSSRCDQPWYVGDVGGIFSRLEDAYRVGGSVTLPRLFWNRELKQAALRTAWNADALSLFFACRTPVQNGHQHVDPMGFDFTALGKPLLVDPGMYRYVDDARRHAVRSASWHNCLTVDDRPPFTHSGVFDLGPQKDGTIVRAADDGGILAVEAIQRSYEPAIHRRLAAIIDGAFLLVLDSLTGIAAASTVQIHYHVDSTTMSWDDGLRRASTADADVRLRLHASRGVRGRIEPGAVSVIAEVMRPSQRLVLEDAGGTAGRRAYATVAIPYRADARPPELAGLEVGVQGDDVLVGWTLDGRRRALRWNRDGLAAQGSA